MDGLLSDVERPVDVVRESWRRIERWVASERALPPVEEIFNLLRR